MAGCGSNSTEESIDLVDHAKSERMDFTSYALLQ